MDKNDELDIYERDDTYKATLKLEQVFEDKTNALLCEEYENEDGELHRLNGPAYVKYDPYTQKPIYILYAQNDRWHREDGPALTEIDPLTNVVTHESWYKHGEQHREGGLPSFISRHEDSGEILREDFWENGQSTEKGKKNFLERYPDLAL